MVNRGGNRAVLRTAWAWPGLGHGTPAKEQARALHAGTTHWARAMPVPARVGPGFTFKKNQNFG